MYNREQDKFRTFGRAKGKALSQRQADLMQNHFPKMEWQVGQALPDKPLWLEIGFGAAEHLLYQAKHNPDVHIIGAEPFLNGVAKAVAGANDNGLENLSLYRGDVRDLIERLPDHSLDRIFILFPDPWPKPRHHKRRLIRSAFIKELHRVLKPGGQLRFGSDIINYVDWALTRFHAHGGFVWEPEQQGDWRIRPEDWPETRYLQKALREGRSGHFFIFKRI